MSQRRNIPESDFAVAAMMMWQGFLQHGPLEAVDHVAHLEEAAPYLWSSVLLLMNEWRKFLGGHPELDEYTRNKRFLHEALPALGAWYRVHRRRSVISTVARAHYSREIHSHYFPPVVEAVGVPTQPGTLSPAASWPYPTLPVTHI
jgi:hypothetical protein